MTQVEFTSIAKAARFIWGVSGIIAIALPLLPSAIVVAWVSSAASIAVASLAVVASIWWWWISGRRWRSWGYAERERDLVIRRGVLVRRLTIVPYGRMQFIEVKQGPIDRLLGTSSLQLHTAAAATDAHIPLLKVAEAERLRKRLTDLGEAHAAGL